MPRHIEIPVDDVETVRLEYQGEWYEVVKARDDLEIEPDESESN